MQDLYLGLPTVLGFLIYSLAGYFIFFKPSREKFWGCFAIGSFLMGSGLVCSSFAGEQENLVILYSLSTAAWLVHSGIYLGGTSWTDNFHTKYEVLEWMLGNPKKLTESEAFNGIYACWDQYHSEAGSFKYRMVLVDPADTLLNKFRKEQHYTYRNLERNFSSIDECKEYLRNMNNTPVKL